MRLAFAMGVLAVPALCAGLTDIATMLATAAAALLLLAGLWGLGARLLALLGAVVAGAHLLPPP